MGLLDNKLCSQTIKDMKFSYPQIGSGYKSGKISSYQYTDEELRKEYIAFMKMGRQPKNKNKRKKVRKKK